jgi:hypothetical protein
MYHGGFQYVDVLFVTKAARFGFDPGEVKKDLLQLLRGMIHG